MKRITERQENRVYFVGGKPLKSCDSLFCKTSHRCKRIKKRTCPYLMVLDRLADYEDIGLDPEEIKKMIGRKNEDQIG